MSDAPSAVAEQPSFHGEGGALFMLHLKSVLLSIVTLGIYSFWGRTRIREYLWSQTELAGDRFAYHGTGGELLKGWAIATAVLAVLYALVSFVIPMLLEPVLGLQGAQAIGGLVLYACIGLLLPVAMVGARRYRLSRTSWRGIRFSFRGSPKDLLKIYIVGGFLTMITLTLYSPFLRNDLRKFFTDHARFGTVEFGFDGKGFDLFRQYFLMLLLTIPTLGLCWFWYAAAQDRYYWEHTSIGEARFKSTMTGGNLLGQTVIAMLLTIFTFGLGAPWAMVRLSKFRCDTLALAGTVDLASIEQLAQAASGTGEGLATALDVDGLDMGIGL